jgi:hypothetical protein
MPYQDPDYPFDRRIEDNERHDRTPHTVTMDPKAKYKGPPTLPKFDDEPEEKRKRLRRVIDQHGVETLELK